MHVHRTDTSMIKSFQGEPDRHMNGRMHEWVTVRALEGLTGGFCACYVSG